MSVQDRIEIKGLLLRTIIGINPEERAERQDVLINITLFCDTRQAARTDNIEDAINYRTVTKKVIELVEGSSFFLLESLAEAIARVCLGENGVEAVIVGVDKPGALRFARSVAVSIRRTKADLK